MKLLPLFLSLCLLLVHIVESSFPNDNLNNNITRGSSLSTSSHDPSYWLSPSGNIAFGFYPLPCEQSSSSCRYVVGIWFAKSPRKTLVWIANRDDIPLSNPSSILLTNEGKFILRMADNKEAPLVPDVHEPVSYAVMHDDGNFVLYGSNSNILWQSFDHPTDTILSGQKLKDGVDLVSGVSTFIPSSGKYKLSVNQTNGLVAIYKFRRLGVDENTSIVKVSEAFEDSISKPVTLNLEIGGNLYLMGSDNVVLRVFHENKKQQPEDENVGRVYIYRATLNPNGHFNVYKERTDGRGDKKSAAVQLWSSYVYWTPERTTDTIWTGFAVLFTVALCGCCIKCYINDKRKQKENRGVQLQSGG